MTLTYPAEWQRQPGKHEQSCAAGRSNAHVRKGVSGRAKGASLPDDMFHEAEAAIEWGTEQEGGIDAIAEILHDFWVASSRNELIGEIVDQASKAIETAGEHPIASKSVEEQEGRRYSSNLCADSG